MLRAGLQWQMGEKEGSRCLSSVFSSPPTTSALRFSFMWKGKWSCDVVFLVSWLPRSEPREEGRGSYCRWLTPFLSYASSPPDGFCRSLSPRLQSSHLCVPHRGCFCLRPGFCRIAPEPSSTFPTLWPPLHLLLPGESPQDFTSGSPPA